MTATDGPTPEQDKQYHRYDTGKIPWYIRAMWIAFWIGLVWYVAKFAVSSAKNYF